jgi:hypothetical protein
MANRRGIALERDCESIARNNASDGGGSGIEDDVWVDANLVNVLLELFPQAIGENGIGSNKEDCTAHILTKDYDGYGNRDLRGRDKILDSYVGLQVERNG